MKSLEIILIPEVREDASQSALGKHIHNNTFLGPLFTASEHEVIRVDYEAGGVRVRVLKSDAPSVSYFYPHHIIQRVKEIQ